MRADNAIAMLITAILLITVEKEPDSLCEIRRDTKYGSFKLYKFEQRNINGYTCSSTLFIRSF